MKGFLYLLLLLLLPSVLGAKCVGRSIKSGVIASSTNVGVVNLLRGEDLTWFFETHMVNAGLPLLLQPSDLDEFLPRAVQRWAQDSVLADTISGFEEFAQHAYLREEEEKKKNSGPQVFRAPFPDALMGDLEPAVAEMHFWKWVPCFHMRPEERGFALTREIVISGGDVVSSELGASGQDLFIWVAQGSKQCTLYPPWDAPLLNATRVAHGLWKGYPPPRNVPNLSVKIPTGWFLYVPLTWFYTCRDDCRTVALEISLDVRGAMHEPYLSRYYRNDSITPHQLWVKMRNDTVVKENTKCDDIAVHYRTHDRVLLRQKRTIWMLSIGVVCTLATMVYMVKGFIVDASPSKEKKA